MRTDGRIIFNPARKPVAGMAVAVDPISLKIIGIPTHESPYGLCSGWSYAPTLYAGIDQKENLCQCGRKV